MNPEDDQELDDSEEALEDDEIEVTFEPRPESLAEAGITEDEFETALLAALEEHEDALRVRCEEGLRQIPGVQIWSRAAYRTPTLLFTVDGVEPAAVHRHLAGLGVNAPASHFYAWDLSHRLGLGPAGGVRVGMAPYTTTEEVDRLLEGVEEVVAARP